MHAGSKEGLAVFCEKSGHNRGLSACLLMKPYVWIS